MSRMQQLHNQCTETQLTWVRFRLTHHWLYQTDGKYHPDFPYQGFEAVKTS